MLRCDDRVLWKGNIGTVMWSNPDETQVNWDNNSLLGVVKTAGLTKALPPDVSELTTGELRTLIEQLNTALYTKLINNTKA